MLEIGAVIDGKYRILSKVGQGGMSTVYLAINEKANKPWAIKEVRKDGVQNFEVVRQSLMVETDLLKKLNHKNLPSIIDVIDQDDNFLIVMDYIEGITLDKIIKEYGPQKQDDVVDWAIQLCDVLQYLHTRTPSIIYRDMKPSNVMLRYDGSVVLIDFGTAREYKTAALGDTTCLGTQGYAAPEQFGGQGQTDPRTDIYCLGATMYHLLTGHNPSKPPYEMYPITHWDASLSSGLESIILKCTQKNPDDRYQSAQDLMDALMCYKDLDAPKLRHYKKTVTLFASIAIMASICFGTSIGTYSYAKSSQKQEYEYLIDVAAKAGNEQDSRDYYLKAIDTDSTRLEAYDDLVDLFLEDGTFSDEEEETLLNIKVSTKKYLQNLEQSDAQGYADICFKIGNAYWFYYSHEESRQSTAVSWYSAAATYYKDIEEMEQEYKRCNIYIEIGNFYKKVISAQVEGTDANMYSEYWNNLCTLKALNDENPDRDLITLRLYEEIITRSMEYGKYLKEDGISKEEIEEMYNEISADMTQMGSNSTDKVKEEIDSIRNLLSQAELMLRSNYREVSVQ
jgi:serine/threonine-protein kinase